MSLAKADEVKSLFASFDGDISIGLINVTLNSVPTFAAYADAKNGNALKALYDNKKQLKLGKNEDIIQLGRKRIMFISQEQPTYSLASATSRCMPLMMNFCTRVSANR